MTSRRGRPRAARSSNDNEAAPAGVTAFMQRIHGKAPSDVTNHPELDAERAALLASGATLTSINALYRQLKILSKASKARLRVDGLRLRVQQAWKVHSFPGVPPLHLVLNQATAARVLVETGAGLDDLCTALGITTNLASNYRSRASSNRPSDRTDMLRQPPDAELSLQDLQAEMRNLIARCREARAYVCALHVCELLCRTLEAEHALQQSSPSAPAHDANPAWKAPDTPEVSEAMLEEWMAEAERMSRIRASKGPLLP